MSNKQDSWIGVDLDGTLAHYDGWVGPEYIGPPIYPMLQRVKRWIAQGKKVKIFTARCSVPEQVEPIAEWLESNGIGGLEITNIKDYAMVELWDDRAIQVAKNTGLPVDINAVHSPACRCEICETGREDVIEYPPHVGESI